jgi:vancomycin resistance protein VanJ
MSVRVELEDPDGAKVNVLGIHLIPIGVTEKSFQGMPAMDRAMTSLKDAAKIQARQVDQIQEVVDAFRDPTIMVGDFNSARNSALHRTLRSGLEDTWESAGRGRGWTREYKNFPLRIDYIYASPVFAAQSVSALDCTMPAGLECSDHRAIVAALHWKQE